MGILNPINITLNEDLSYDDIIKRDSERHTQMLRSLATLFNVYEGDVTTVMDIATNFDLMMDDVVESVMSDVVESVMDIEKDFYILVDSGIYSMAIKSAQEELDFEIPYDNDDEWYLIEDSKLYVYINGNDMGLLDEIENYDMLIKAFQKRLIADEVNTLADEEWDVDLERDK